MPEATPSLLSNTTQQTGWLQPDARRALIAIDVQNCFCSGGSLAVAGGDEVVPLINQLGAVFGNVVLTQDWHPAGHASFATSHAGRQPFDNVDLHYGPQVLWPVHAVQGSHGAAFHAGLQLTHAQLVVRKGWHAGIDSYSAFFEADRRTPTGLVGYLRERGVQQLFLAGLATDFCVAWSALDAAAAGFDTWVVEDATRAINLNGSLDAAWQQMAAVGVHRIQSGVLLAAQQP